MDETLDLILREGAVLCVRLNSEKALVEYCRAAVRGGLRVLELTLTTPGAFDAMRQLAADGAIVGGGTVLSADQVHQVAEAGGRFAFSPVFDPVVVDEAHRRNLLAVPGTATPTEALAAHRHGARLIKVFPSAVLGGPAYIRALRNPLPDIPLIPASGPTADNLADYFAAGASAVGVGIDVFTPGFTQETVEAASRRVADAVATARRNGTAVSL